MRRPSGRKSALLIAIGWLAIAPYAFAQDITPPASDTAAPDTKKPADGDKAPVRVTVKGHKKPVKPADRDVYDVSQDPATQTGTIADTLKKIPGVVVEPSGQVTLHGKAVTIMVDGRRSLILSGDNQADALRSMPSSFITSVEVITSPGAEFGSEGSGGIINLVTNHHMPVGGMAGVSLQATSTGGYDVNTFGNYHIGRLTAQGFAMAHHDFGLSRSASTLADIGGDGHALETTHDESLVHNASESLMASGELQYELGHDDMVAAKVQAMDFSNRLFSTSRSDSSGTTTNLYTTAATNQSAANSGSLDIDWVHYGHRTDEKLTLSASLSQNSNRSGGRNVDSYSVSSLAANTGDRTTTNQSRGRDDGAGLKADYDGPVWDDQIHLGVEIQSDRNRSDSSTITPEPLTPVAGIIPLTERRFTYRQTLSAAYVTYQKELGEAWTVLGGLRAETLDLDTDFISLKSTGHLVYTRLNPSLFATYVVSKKAKLHLSYTRRLQRPVPDQLNPYVVLLDATHVDAGNPNLKPQDTDVYEARYIYNDRMMSLSLRGFYNRDQHLIASSTRFIADPQNLGNQVLETTTHNYGFRDDAGLEAIYNNVFREKLNVGLNATVRTIWIRNPDIPGTQADTIVSGGLNLGYTLSPKTSLSSFYQVNGRQVTGQGYSIPGSILSLSLFQILTPKLSLSVTVSDPLRAGKSQTVIDTTTVHSRSVGSQVAPTFMISLNRSYSHFGK